MDIIFPNFGERFSFLWFFVGKKDMLYMCLNLYIHVTNFNDVHISIHVKIYTQYYSDTHTRLACSWRWPQMREEADPSRPHDQGDKLA